MTWTLDAFAPTLDASVSLATFDGYYNVLPPLDPEPPYVPYSPGPLFLWSPSYGAPKKTSFDLRKATFGDGYQQRTGKGINNIKRQWDLVFNSKPENTAMDIQIFLEARKDGGSFLWRPPFLNPYNETLKVICTEFTIIPATYRSFNITATFEQVFGE